MRNFRESPPPPLPAFRAAQVWNLLAPDPRFRENKMGVHATSHGKDLNPAFGGVSDRVKLSRLRRQIRTLSAFLPFFTCAMAARMAVHVCEVGVLIPKARLPILCLKGGSPCFLQPVFGATALKSSSK